MVQKNNQRIRIKISRSNFGYERGKNSPDESPSQPINSGHRKNSAAELEQPELWWHLRPRLHDSIDQYLQVGDKPPEILDRSVRHVLGRLGLIFEDYKFNVSARGISVSYKEFWFEHPSGDESVSVPLYPHLLAWSQKMQDSIRNYNMEYVEANAIFVEVQKLKQEKKRQQAMSRWEDI